MSMLADLLFPKISDIVFSRPDAGVAWTEDFPTEE